MNESLAIVLKNIRLIWRRRWVALISTTLFCLGGWIFVLTIPDVYEARATVYMDTSSLLKPLLKGLAVDSSGRTDAARMVRRILLTRPSVEALARTTDMDLKAKTPEQLEEIFSRLQNEIVVSETNRDNTFNLSYRNEDPKLATRVVEELLNMFVEKSLGENRTDTGHTRRFIEQQIADYESKLQTAEERLKEFKQRNMGLLPSQGGDYYSRLEAIRRERAEASLQLAEAERRRDAFKQQMEEPFFDPGIDQAVSTALTPLDGRIQNLETRLDELLLSYTDEHPDVISAKRVLGELKQRRESELKEARAAMLAEPDMPREHPLNVALSEAEAQIAALGARVQEYERRENELKSIVDNVLSVEAEFAQLNRDYNIYKEKYQALVDRRETLNLSEDANQTSDDLQLKVIEPPREPVLPLWPNRPMLNALVLLVGVGGGVGLAWLIAMLRPGVYTKEEFAEFTDVPVLGMVSRLWTPATMMQRRMEMASFAVGCLCLLGLVAVIYGVIPIETDVAAKFRGLNVMGKFNLESLKQVLL